MIQAMNKFGIGMGAKILSVSLVAMIVWWISITVRQLENSTENFVFGALLGVIPCIVALLGFSNFKKWGGLKSVVGKSILFLSLGYLLWGIGTLIFAYYNIVLQVEVPYPSVADAFYIFSWPLWAIGIILLSRSIGVKVQMKTGAGRAGLVLIPTIAAIISYYLLIVVARDRVLFDTPHDFVKTFFDLAYPIGTLVIVTLVFLVYTLSIKFLGGFFKWPILLLLSGFVFNYIGDFGFAYTVTKETFFVANWVDLIFLVAFSLMGIGLSLINPKRVESDVPVSNNLVS